MNNIQIYNSVSIDYTDNTQVYNSVRRDDMNNKLYKNKAGNYLYINKIGKHIMIMGNNRVELDYEQPIDDMIEITDFYQKVEVIGFPNTLGMS